MIKPLKSSILVQIQCSWIRLAKEYNKFKENKTNMGVLEAFYFDSGNRPLEQSNCYRLSKEIVCQYGTE
jgi:hypothetical protein